MRKSIQALFDYMSKDENWFMSVLLVMIYTLFVVGFGWFLAWFFDKLVSRKLRKQEYYFNDGAQQPMRIIRKKQDK